MNYLERQRQANCESAIRRIEELDKYFYRASAEINANASENRHKKPAFSTLLEEFAELVLSLRGKHDDPPELEIKQIGGICINLLAQIYDGELDHVNNIGSKNISAENAD